MSNASCGNIDVYDKGGGALLVSWPPFPGTAPDSYNLYVNGALNQNVATRVATVTGLQEASYSASAIAPAGNGSARPQNLPPNGVETPSATYDIKVVAVKAGVETAASLDRTVTLSPNNIMLTTPMRRPFPFPNTAPGG